MLQTHIPSAALQRRLRSMAYLAFGLAALFSTAAWLSTFPAIQVELSKYGLGVNAMSSEERLGVYALSGLFATLGTLSWLGGNRR